MTAKDAIKYLGKRGIYNPRDGIGFEVEIENAREMFGRIDLHIKPVAGKGSAWVDAGFVKLGS